MSSGGSQRSKGINQFAILLILSSIVHIQKLIEASNTYFVQYFGNLPEWLLLSRYGFSWTQRAVGILVAVGLLARKDIARKVGIGLGIFTVSTLYWKHPYDAFKEHTKWLDAHYGAVLRDYGIYNLKFSDYTLLALIGQCVGDILFWGIFIYYFTRPAIKAQFKPK